MSPLRRAMVLTSIVLILITVGASYVGWVSQLHAGLPLVPVIVTDKEQYRVGENIRATLLYVNPNPHSVSFTPPSTVFIYLHKWPDSTTPINIGPEESPGTAETIWRVAQWIVVGPNEEFKVISYTFIAPREGTFLVQLEHMTKQIQITS